MEMRIAVIPLPARVADRHIALLPRSSGFHFDHDPRCQFDDAAGSLTDPQPLRSTVTHEPDQLPIGVRSAVVAAEPELVEHSE